MLAQSGEQIFPSQAGMLAQRVERIGSQRIRQVMGRNILIWSGPDPGLCDSAVSPLLQLLDEVA